MTNPVAIVRTTKMHGQESPVWRTLWMWCPACDLPKGIPVPGADGQLPPEGRPHWQWSGDLERPTLAPSILQHESGSIPRCHSFLRDGRWEFLGDCTHKLAGQTVDMVPLPDWLVLETTSEPEAS